MTESASGGSYSNVVVSPVMAGSPPFRIVQVYGEVAGRAHDVVDVLHLLRAVGIPHPDLDDPSVVRWEGGDKFTWGLRHK
ncbi:hypothetical protein [Streptomyces sp. A1136]|uniref:hypothetical protein n=1 Tax=Streptomyces sp. A1136 TaxID=2563102 RepID=UPI00109EDC2D|nr:hypothetical protein [Streptomyces sp. A1136]THA50338.1 hypothetical protein E6R62_25280 [Streptomyces sp. A1136]